MKVHVQQYDDIIFGLIINFFTEIDHILLICQCVVFVQNCSSRYGIINEFWSVVRSAPTFCCQRDNTIYRKTSNIIRSKLGPNAVYREAENVFEPLIHLRERNAVTKSTNTDLSPPHSMREE